LILYLRPARRKAREAATLEALCLLRDLDPAAPRGGPLAEQGGLFWLTLPSRALPSALARFPQLGYTQAVDVAEPAPELQGIGHYPGGGLRMTRWRGQAHRLRRVYEEDAQALRERAPDRRVFLLETPDGAVRPIKGYRGDGRALSRRGLPVYDARLLVNLVFRPEKGTLLDPFAGIGGIALEALAAGWHVLSADVDPALRHGLAQLGACHVVADARELPFAPASVDAIATEPPYDQLADGIVVAALREMHRVLKEGGRLALLCAARQADDLRREGAALGLAPYLDSPINRKGMDVVALAWQK
jgi:SAM-dependent methyltransferase